MVLVGLRDRGGGQSWSVRRPVLHVPPWNLQGFSTGLSGLWSPRCLLPNGVLLPPPTFTPSIQWSAVRFGNWSLHLTAFGLYSPWGGILFSEHSLLAGMGPGIQRWVYEGEGLGFYLNGALLVAYQLRGDIEGGGDRSFILPSFQAGVSF